MSKRNACLTLRLAVLCAVLGMPLGFMAYGVYAEAQATATRVYAHYYERGAEWRLPRLVRWLADHDPALDRPAGLPAWARKG